jgi:putative ABC transport system permease protein
MGLASTLAYRSLVGKPSRTFFSILGIAVGIATSVCVFTLDYNTVLGRSISADPDWQAEIEVAPSGIVTDPRAELARVPGVKAVTASFQSDALLVPGDRAGEKPERIHFVALDAEHAAELGALRVSLGRLIDARARVAEVVIGQNLAERLSLDLGDSVLVSRPARAPARECVDGEWRDRQRLAEHPSEPLTCVVVGVLTREGLGRKASGDVCVVDYRYGAALYEGAHVQTRYWLKKDPQVDLEHLQSSLGQAWSYQLKKSVIVGQAADERAFRNGVRFAGLLAMVLGLYVIFHTLSMSLVERVREIGVLNALGATRAQIGRAFLAEAMLIAGVGGVVGLAGGLLGARFLLLKGITTVGAGEHISVFDVPWRTILPLVAAGVGIALVGSIYPLIRARGANVVAALRGDDGRRAAHVSRGFQWLTFVLLAVVLPLVYFRLVPVIGEAQAELVGVLLMGLGVVALFISVPLIAPAVVAWVCARLAGPFELVWPFSGKFAARSLLQNPTRIATSVAAMALVTSGYVGLRGMTRSLEKEIAIWGREAFYDKVFVRNLPGVDFDALAKHLHRYPDVLGVEPGDSRTYVPFLLLGLRTEELAQYGPCRDQPILMEKMRRENGVIVSKRLAGQQKYEVGDFIHVSPSRGDVQSWPIVAISDEYGYFPHPDERLYAVTSDKHTNKIFCIDDKTVDSVAIRLRAGVKPKDMEPLIRTALADLLPAAQVSVESGPSLYAWHTTDIARDFVLFDVIVGLTIALAAVGVLNGQLLSALERAKELGVLKALGASLRQISGSILLEAAVIGAVGGALGALLGWAVTPVIVRSLVVISGLPLPVAGPGPHLGLAWVGAVVVTLVAALYPISRIRRMSAAAAVRAPG